MKHMKQSRTFGLVACAFCIMAVMIAAVSAIDTSGSVIPGEKNSSPIGTNNNQEYNISQTLSDQAQGMTIAFDALAFMTGDACSDTFLPPGKVADYAGFQYLRDNDKTEMGHNTDFVTRTADNVLITLNDAQLAQFVALSKEESTLSDQFGYMRFPLTTAFRDQLAGTLPDGSSGLDKAAVMAYSGKLYDIDASISLDRAKTYASVINSLNQTQRAYLDKMKSEGMLSYPVVDASEILKNSGQSNSVAMRTYASEMFAWYAGSVEADVYFCPERQGTYFGSFYMKDAPAMSNPNYSISTTLTGDSGEATLNLLTSTQRQNITNLVDIQRADLNEIVATRQAIAIELRRPLTGGTIDENAVRTLSARYGALDGEISYYYATHFANVGKTLTSKQMTDMVALRNLTDYTCKGAYLYSQTISMPQDIPSAFLFGVGTYNATEMSAWIIKQQTVPIVTPTVTPTIKPTVIPTVTPIVPDNKTFSLSSDAGPDGGTMPIEYTCDGTGCKPALSWSGTPSGTKEFALMMTTIPVDGVTKWNWILYSIPGNTTSLAKNSSDVGILGTGSHGTVMSYDPPCPEGVGAKIYTFTLYALSASPTLPGTAELVTGPVLTSAISSITLGKTSFNLSYTRQTSAVTSTGGVFRSGTFYRNGATQIAYGMVGDTPVTGDWNGDGTTEVGVFRSGTFYRNGATQIAYGMAGDIPVTGDWNGDGTTEVGVFRSGTFYRDGATSVAYGMAGDTPVTGDWNGDGLTEVGVFRSGTFYRNGATQVAYGLAGDTPVTGDWNGDGSTEVGVFRSGTFYRNGATQVAYGITGDTPVTGKWN